MTDVISSKSIPDNSLYVLPGESGDYWFLAAAYLAQYFHPDLFADFDPIAIHREFLNRFQGLDFDIDARGVFVYALE